MRKYFFIDYRADKPVLAYDTIKNLNRRFGPKLPNGSPEYDIEGKKIYKYDDHGERMLVCERTTQRAAEEEMVYLNCDDTAEQTLFLQSWALLDEIDDLLAEPGTAELGRDLLMQFRNALWSEPKDPLR